MLQASTRLLRLLSLLQTRRHWAGAELAERLQVHPRTLRRDIDRLRQLGYPIQASSGVAGGYAFRPGQALPPLLLDDEEALAVAIALHTATTGTVEGIAESALRALVKLEHVMPAPLRRRTDALRSAILPLESIGPTVEANLLATVAAACRDQLQLRFAYADSRGRSSQRTVEPQGVVHTDHRWYLVAWDPERDDWRTFRIDRISGPATPGQHFAPRSPPGQGDLAAFVSRSLAVAPYSEQARVILHAPLAQMACRIPSSAGLLEAVDDERCLLQTGAHALDRLVYWLMALDVAFEVLAPPALQERLQRASERLAGYLAGAASEG
ncbi:YafY family transcriptional regulator [Chitiniphilus purpureus]|uniref:YafY family transcriptional regulator n=1 Tax=Chitiniphilus purpureus TaxID=2981137 RepID=A0ABY6DN69_9NEIS|nr:YafY family protein [Chitiniphilus sp. CD1]UXY14556.1 YafY family transcriptional regulator [Chitiniphilus sp. CD1]